MTSMNPILGVLLLCSTGLADCSGKGAAPQGAGTADTTILGSRQQAFTMNADTPYYQAAIALPGNKLPAGKKIMLVLDDVSVPVAPDGTYELFISAMPHGNRTPHAPAETFAEVLDIYALTAEQLPSRVTADITKKVTALSKNDQLPGTLHIAIRFAGNTLANGTASKSAGTLIIRGIKLQVY